MNKYVDNTVCSRASVERYLLNRMTTDEETLFQEHLLVCDTCKGYLNILRNVAGISNDELTESEAIIREMPKPESMNEKKKRTTALSVNMRWVLLAACLIPICLIMLYQFLREQGVPHDTHIMRQNKASVEYADTLTLFFPAQPDCIVNPSKAEIVFRWNRESDYRLLLETAGKTVATIDSVGISYTVDTSLALRYEQLDWTLVVAGKELKGRLYIQTK